MKVNDIFHGASLKASDLAGRDCRVTIKSYEIQEFDDGSKLVISFEKTERTLVCNKTNANTIANMYGQEIDDWIGRQIVLYPTQTDLRGKQVECIRVRIQTPEPRPIVPAPKAPPEQTEYVSGDEVPF